ncbi:hypothetical protein Dimus_001265, partial [Dionaea muscipula]
KEFYAKMKVTHLRKKDVIKSSVKGIDIVFDHERLATILGVPSRNGICEYIKEVWEESKYTKPLEITRRVANDETITIAIWKERHFKLHGSDIYGSSNDKEVSQSATSDDETHELCDLYEGS